MLKGKLLFIQLSILLTCLTCQSGNTIKKEQVFEVNLDTNHAGYFSINDAPILLLGGSNNDNIFQDHPIEPQLDTLLAYGGNYIRCTLSSRDFANQWPYQQRGNALYDLEEFSEAYWSRLDKFFKITQQKGIVVQLEIWDTRDYYQSNNWAKHPFNPYYNTNYKEQPSGMPTDISNYDDSTIHPFFETVPTLKNNKTVLYFQQKLIEKLLSYTFKYQHILYSINNEFVGSSDWSGYWVQFIKQKAKEKKHKVLITDTFDNLQKQASNKFFSAFNGTKYDFADISMQSILNGEAHFQRINTLKKSLGDKPVTLVKIFGGEQNDFTGTFEDGPERFWKSIFAGVAAVRFHQPPQGAGLNRLAQVNMKSLRMLTDSVDFFNMEPANDLLKDRQENEAFCLAETGKSYILYYPGCGEIILPLQNTKNELQVKWLNILNAQWDESYEVETEQTITLKSPCEGKWAVRVKVL